MPLANRRFITIVMQGDPVWAISQATITDLVGLSLNFFFILPLINSGTPKFQNSRMCINSKLTALRS
jgi:hypothetical protein